MRLTHVRLLVEDFSASYRFYRDGLGLPTAWPDNGAYAEFDAADDLKLALLPRGEMDSVGLRPAGDGVLLVIDVGDVDAAASQLRDRGIEPVDEPHDRADWGLRVLHVRDPDGNLVELFHDIEWQPE